MAPAFWYLVILILAWFAARSWAAYLVRKRDRARKVARDFERWAAAQEERRELHKREGRS